VRAPGPCCDAVPGNRPIEVATQLQQQELFQHVDLGDLRTVAPQNSHEVVTFQPLQGFAHRGAANTELRAELRLGPNAAGRQLQRDNHVFEARACLF
jgi:hypothetical protein